MVSNLGGKDTCLTRCDATANNMFDKTHGVALRLWDLDEEEELPADEDWLERDELGEDAFFFFFFDFLLVWAGAAGTLCG